MANTVREQIMEQLLTMLGQISTVNGYANNIAAVERWEQRGNSLANTPKIILVALEEVKIATPNPFYTCHLPIVLDVWISQDENDTQATDKILVSILGDVEKCIMADPTIGGYCQDALFKSNKQFQGVIGQPYAGIEIVLEVLYRHRLTDPTQSV